MRPRNLILTAAAAALLEIVSLLAGPGWNGIALHGTAALLVLAGAASLIRRGESALGRGTRALVLRIGQYLGRTEGNPPVRRLVAAKCDIEHRLWKLWHPGRSYADFYAWQVTRKLDRGGTHKTLGRRAFRPSGLVSAGDVHDAATFASAGLAQFLRIRAAGLNPGDVVVDFGCGSLRVGQHLMRYLAPGNYWGLDVTDRFYCDGAATIGAAEMARCRPNLRVIGATSLADARAARPSLVVSIAVLKHVPPSERAEYFDRLMTLAGDTGRLLISFTATPAPKRILGKSWSVRPADVIREIERRRPGARFEVMRLDGGVPEITGRGTSVFLTAVWPEARRTRPSVAARAVSMPVAHVPAGREADAVSAV